MARVTVCIPAYNRSVALRPTIDSVVDQTWADWELLVVDDGSTDDTASVASSYADPRIRCIRQRNQGQAEARNRGLAEAGGEYVAFLDHDDRWAPEKLGRQVSYLDAHPECGVVYGRLRGMDQDGALLEVMPTRPAEGWVYPALLVQHNFLATMSNPLMRVALVRAVEGFRTDAGLSDDWDLFLRLAKLTQFGFLDEVLVHYNLGNEHSQTRNLLRVFESERTLLRRYLASDRTLSPAIRRASEADLRARFAPAFREQGWHALRRGEVSRAWKLYAQAVRLRPAYLAEPTLLRDLAGLIRSSVARRAPATRR